MTIPFKDIGIDPDLGKSVVKAILDYIETHCNDQVSLQKIIEQTGFPGDEVKGVFYVLLTLRYLKPTFLPRHHDCESAIGGQEFSIVDIRRKFENGDYPLLCGRCHEEISNFDELDIEIIFWKGRGGLSV